MHFQKHSRFLANVQTPIPMELRIKTESSWFCTKIKCQVHLCAIVTCQFFTVCKENNNKELKE